MSRSSIIKSAVDEEPNRSPSNKHCHREYGSARQLIPICLVGCFCWASPLGLLAEEDDDSLDEGDSAEIRLDGASGSPAVRAAELQAEPCETPPPGMSCVHGGTFLRGVDRDTHRCDQPGNQRRPATTPSSLVFLDTFYLDQHEVTNQDYLACVQRGACSEAGPRYADFGAPNQPITGLSWFEARAFCEAAGKRLPTEAQWEKAARGPTGDPFPWGETQVTCELAVIRDESGRSCGALRRRGSTPETGRVFEVGSRPAGRYGLFDMIGNAEEWVADWWSPDWEACGEACAGPNPLGPCAGADQCPEHRYRVVRGGSWYWDASHATGYHRRRHHPANDPFHHFGFRCAASVEQARTLTPDYSPPSTATVDPPHL